MLDLRSGRAGAPSTVHVVDGRLSREPGPSARVLDARGALLVPGLWDAHVHVGQLAVRSSWADLSAATSPDHAASLTARLAGRGSSGLFVGTGVRDARWTSRLQAGLLDVVDRPVLLVSSDLHSAWANRAGLSQVGLPHHADGHLREQDAFTAQLNATVVDDDELDRRVQRLARHAATLGLVGWVDMEMADNPAHWRRRCAGGFTTLRVRAAVYPHHLPAVAGLHTGDVLDERGLAVMGPLKVITDGSLTARTAWCRRPYLGGVPVGEDGCGVPSIGRDELTDLLDRARAQGLDVALHAIGDRALGAALDAIEESGARGSIEHAQLATDDDAARMARLGVTASVQPAHLVDDRDAVDELWADRTQHAFPLRSMVEAGVPLRLGSDAPVAALDPWLAISAAVTRTDGQRPAWHPEQSLTLSQALMASTGAVRTLVPGASADLMLLEQNPFDLAPGRLAAVRPVLTMVAGRVTHDAR